MTRVQELEHFVYGDPALFDLSKFGTAEFPLRASGLQAIAKCPWRIVSMLVLDSKDEAGPAAHTGSAMHAAVERFHQDGDVVAAVEAMHGRRDEYPMADLDDAAKLFFAYSQDPRNAGAKVVLSETKASFSIKPHPEDPTQAPICVSMRLDQVRWDGAQFKLFDLKTSKRDGPTLLAESIYQISAYCVGASVVLGKTVEPGALITPRKYLVRGTDPSSAPPGVFWHYTFNYAQCEHVLRGVREIVAHIRSGRVWLNGGDYCNWCIHRGVDVCVHKFAEWDAKREQARLALSTV